MKSQAFEILPKDLLKITIKESYKLQEVLTENFNSLDASMLKVPREEYQKPKNDWRIISGCFSVISKFSEKYPKIAGSVL